MSADTRLIAVAPPTHQAPLVLADSALSATAREATLLQRLAHQLDQNGIPYCQWKGHWSTHRWSAGEGDIDLLVDHGAGPTFRRVMEQLGFKPGQPPVARQITGTEYYIGHDPALCRLLRLHVRYRLLMGDYWKPVYRIPIERQLLDGAVPGSLFRVPAPTHQYLVFVLRLMLRQVGRPLLSVRSQWTNGIRVPLESLDAAADRDLLGKLLEQHLGGLDLGFFDRCVRSLQGRSGLLERAALPWLLHRILRAHLRTPGIPAMMVAAVEKCLPARLADRLTDARLRPAGGGLVLALVGGDHTGKSTCARALAAWLAPVFPVIRTHLSNPQPSWLTLLVGGTLKIQQRISQALNRSGEELSWIELLRRVCTARDRYRLYLRARRVALRGGIAVCELYPMAENGHLVGPSIPELLPGNPGALAKLLRDLEASYCQRMVRPDLGIMLRGPGEIISDADWTSTGALVVDVSQSPENVLQRMKAIVWSAL